MQPQFQLTAMSSAKEDSPSGILVLSTGPSHKCQEHQREEDSYALRAGGVGDHSHTVQFMMQISRWTLTQGDVNTVMYRAKREIRQEQNRPKALSLRKLCFYFLREECAGGGRKGRR